MTQPHERFVEGAADVAARLAALEEGRRQNATSAALAAQAVVDLKEDIHDLRVIQSGMRDDFTAHRIALTADLREILAEAKEAAAQARLTNGRVGEMERWKKQHEDELRPLMEKAEKAFPVLAQLQEWQQGQSSQEERKRVVRGFLGDVGRGSWRALFALFGMATAAALAVRSILDVGPW